MLFLILQLAVVGLIVWLITTKIPMDPAIKLAIQIIVLVCVVVYLAQLFGVADLPLPRLHR
jgi:hypothetical protein